MTIPSHILPRAAYISDMIIGDTIGLCQAMDLLRGSLDQLQQRLDAREYEKASSLGYRDISENFIFLQRCLGGLQSGCHDRDSMIAELASDNKTSFEEEAPGVYAEMEAMQPNPDKAAAPGSSPMEDEGNQADSGMTPQQVDELLDNGLRAKAEAGWAIAVARLKMINEMQAKYDALVSAARAIVNHHHPEPYSFSAHHLVLLLEDALKAAPTVPSDGGQVT